MESQIVPAGFLTKCLCVCSSKCCFCFFVFYLLSFSWLRRGRRWRWRGVAHSSCRPRWKTFRRKCLCRKPAATETSRCCPRWRAAWHPLSWESAKRRYWNSKNGAKHSYLEEKLLQSENTSSYARRKSKTCSVEKVRSFFCCFDGKQGSCIFSKSTWLCFLNVHLPTFSRVPEAVWVHKL